MPHVIILIPYGCGLGCAYRYIIYAGAYVCMNNYNNNYNNHVVHK